MKAKTKLTLECPECKSKLVIIDPMTVQALDTCCEVRCPLCYGSEYLGPPFMVIVES